MPHLHAFRLLLILVGAATQTGCLHGTTTSTPVTVVGSTAGTTLASRQLATGPGTGAAISVKFNTPREIIAIERQRSDTVQVQGVISMLGRIVAVHGDTLRVVLTATTSTTERNTYRSGRGPEATVILDAGVSVNVLSKHPSYVQGLFIGIVVGALAVAAMVLYAAVSGT